MKKKKLMITFFLGVIILLSSCNVKKESSKTISSTTNLFIEESMEKELFDNKLNKLGLDSYFKGVLTPGQNPEVKLEMLYTVDWRDKDWKDVDFSIDKVKIVEVDSFEINEQQKYQGLIAVHYNLKNDSKQELSIYPEKAHLVLADDKILETDLYLEHWDNAFAVNKYTDGLIYFLLKDVGNLSQSKEFDIQFNVKNRSTDSLNERTYQVKLPLVLASDNK